MLRRTFLSALGLVGLSLCLEASLFAAEKSKILYLTESKGFKHGSVDREPTDKPKRALAPSEIALTQLGQQTGLFTIHCTQDTKSDFTKENLKNYDIVAFYTTGELPISDETRDYFINEWLKQKGHGWMGFHSAADTFRTNDPAHKWYWDLAGGTFKGHPWNAGELVTVTVHDTTFPAMKAFGDEFQIKDEIYEYDHWVPENVHVLMSLNMEKCQTKRPYQVPVAWCRSWGDGKIFVNNLGHNESTWTDKRFLDSTEAAIRWIRNEASGNSAPNPDVSKAWQEKSAKAGAAK